MPSFLKSCYRHSTEYLRSSKFLWGDLPHHENLLPLSFA